MDNISNINNSWKHIPDTIVVKKIGEFVKQIRLNKNLKQNQLAEITGLNRKTISRIENGKTSTLLTLVQVLRGLNKLDILNTFTKEQQLSPLQLLKIQNKQRERASGKRANTRQKDI